MSGTFESPTIDLGTGSLRGAGGGVNDLFLMKLDPNGKTVWAKRYGDAAEQIDLHISPDPAGGVVATGWFNGTLDFGSGPVRSPLGKGFFAARIDAQGGGLWGRAFGHRIDYAETGSVVAANGDVIVSAGSDAVGDIVQGGHASMKDDLGPVIVRYTAAGERISAARYGRGADNLTTGIGLDREGGLRLATTARGTTTFDGVDTTPPEGKELLIVTSFDARGAVHWSRKVLTESLLSIAKMCVDREGRTLVTGDFQAAMPVGGSHGAGYVIVLNAEGDVEWALRVEEGWRTSMNGLDFDTDGNVVVTGAFSDSIGKSSKLWVAKLLR